MDAEAGVTNERMINPIQIGGKFATSSEMTEVVINERSNRVPDTAVLLTEVNEHSSFQPARTNNKPKGHESSSYLLSKRFYPGDVVVKKVVESGNLREWLPFFGTVLKPAVDSQMAKNLDKGSDREFHVHWDFSSRIAETSAEEVALVDRILLRGQRIQNYNGDIGTVSDYKVTASVQINGTNHVVCGVPLHRLRPISPYVRGQEVLHNGWVGVVTRITRNVWFRMDGGILFHVEVTENDGFTRTDPYWGLGVACPGMRTRLPVAALKAARWSSSALRFISKWFPLHYVYSWAYSTIIKTEVIEVEVKWLKPAPGNSNVNLKEPDPVISRRDLKQLLMIGTPSTETIGINSVRKLRVLPHDEIMSYDNWIEKFKKKFVDENDSGSWTTTQSTSVTQLRALLGSADDETPVKVLLRHNLVTVQWEDGTVEIIPAVNIPMIAPTADDGEFPMGLAVAPIRKDDFNGDKYGIVMESNELAKSRSRKVNVRWIIKGQDVGAEEVSVFDIKPHPTYSLYQRGTIVFPRDTSVSNYTTGIITDVSIHNGKMVILRSSDNRQDEVYPHQVVALSTRCHWSFFSKAWILDEMIPPPYQLEIEFDPVKRLVNASEQKYNLLDVDTNNPQDDSNVATLWDEQSFELLPFAPKTHRYYSSTSEIFGPGFSKRIEKEIQFLKESQQNVPEGIWIRCYEDRLDLLSVLMVGPTKIPYEDVLFLFELKLPSNFPTSRPAVHYVSYTLEVHPLLGFDGNVCVTSIPWESNVIESHSGSYITLFLSRIQALLFTPTPYYADRHKKPEESEERGLIKSRLYNQGVVVRVMDSAWNMIQNPQEPWERCIRNHFVSVVPEKLYSIDKWMKLSNEDVVISSENGLDTDLPAYPLLPLPDGMKLALASRIELFKKLIATTGETCLESVEITSVTDTTADSVSHSVADKENDINRLLTPIPEITEPSSSSTFGGKNSTQSVKSDDPDLHFSLDSLKNVKQKDLGAIKEVEEIERNFLSSNVEEEVANQG